MAVHFYMRFKFFVELAPLLQTAKDADEEARVACVLGGGPGSPADLRLEFPPHLTAEYLS